MKKYTVQHTGRPFGPMETATENDWSDYSKHASLSAADKAIRKYTAHLSPGAWDDHYRIVDPDGHVLDRDEYLEQLAVHYYEIYQKKYERQ